MAAKGGAGGSGKVIKEKRVSSIAKKGLEDERTQKEDGVSHLSKNAKPTFLRPNEPDEDTGKEKKNEEKDKAKEKEADKDEEISFGSKKDKRVRWCLTTMNKPCRMIIKEFIRNKATKPENYTYEFFKMNDERNRYADIICIDSTRVVLKNREDDKNYIHASWITLPDGYKYICTQGPLADYLDDFWHMIATEKSPVIVMLCCLKEGASAKCDRYYPTKDRRIKLDSAYKVKYVSQEKDLAEGISVFIYELTYKEQTQKITHYQCSTWSDHLAPLDPAPIIKMLRETRAIAKENPITVHCSAGIGRTSSYVGIDFAVQKIKNNDKYVLVDLLKELRTMRFHAVQGPMQYLFLNLAIVEYFIQDDVVKRKTHFTKFHKEFKQTNDKYGRIHNMNLESSKKKKKPEEKK